MKAKKIWFSEERLFIETSKGEIYSQPLNFYPRLLRASDAQRKLWKQSYGGLHWEMINEDISFDSFLWGDNDPLRLYHIQK
jgi:hypothetical protein